MADKRGGLLSTKFPARGAFKPLERMPDWMRVGERWREQGIPAYDTLGQQTLMAREAYARERERQEAARLGRRLPDLQDLQEGVVSPLLGAVAQVPGVAWGAEQLGAAMNSRPGREVMQFLDSLPPNVDLGAGDLAKGLLAGAALVPKLGKRAAAGIKFGELGSKAKGGLLAGMPRQQEAVQMLIDRASPEMRMALRSMSSLEQSKVLNSEDTLRGAEELLRVIPHHRKMAAVMKAGEAKKGWYEASAKALLDVFGMDAPRFAGLLAATSPQTSVESNLQNALSIWVNWDKAGRPRDPRAIKAVMGASVQGAKGEGSVLDAWVNNTVTALSAENPASITLSGPKVDSFMQNLMGNSRRVTLDAWMANGLGMAQDIFGGSPTALQQAKGNPGITSDYAVVSAQMRRAGRLVGMTPAEAQETFWSVAMPLYEGAKRHKMSAQELLNKGLFKNRDVRGTPDFSSLFKQGKNREILERGGYGDKLDAMQSYQWPDLNLDAAPDLSPKQQRYLMEFARILDDTSDLRRTESRAVMVPGPKQNEVFANSTYGYIPGANVGVGEQAGVSPGILGESVGKRKNFSDLYNNAMTDLRGRDTLLSSAFPGQTTTVRPTTGNFSGPGGVEYQPAFSASTQVRYSTGKDGLPAMHSGDMAALRAVERTRGLLTQQHGTPFNAIVPSKDPRATSGFVTRPKKTSIEAIQAAGAVDPTMAYADTGMGVAALDVGGGTGPMHGKKLDSLKMIFGDDKVAPEAYSGFNVGDYVDNQPGWLDHPMGSGVLTDQWLQEVDALPKGRKGGLDRGLQEVSRRIRANVIPRLGADNLPRQDVQNFLQFGEGGIEAIRRARKAGVALPAIGAGVGLRGLLSSDDGGEQRRY